MPWCLVVIPGACGVCGGAWWGGLTCGTYAISFLGGARWCYVVKGQKNMETGKELEELAARVEQLAIAIRQHMAANNREHLGAWGHNSAELFRQCAQTLRRQNRGE